MDAPRRRSAAKFLSERMSPAKAINAPRSPISSPVWAAVAADVQQVEHLGPCKERGHRYRS